ncbi:MAG: hypothetical protein JXR91_11415 [Deltaproteobacteria bacterium]|nr:hypothetical protein [Deltaproteobacteria bacterium]
MIKASQKIAVILIFTVFCLTQTSCENSISGECDDECIAYLDTGSEPDTMRQYCFDSGGMDLEEEKIKEIITKEDNCFSGNIIIDKDGQLNTASNFFYDFLNLKTNDKLSPELLTKLNSTRFDCIKTYNAVTTIYGGTNQNIIEIETILSDAGCFYIFECRDEIYINDDGYLDYVKSYSSDTNCLKFVECKETELKGMNFPCLKGKSLYPPVISIP